MGRPRRTLYRWLRGDAEEEQLLAAWPLSRKANCVDHVNASQTAAELSAVHRGSPFGDLQWSEETVRRLGLEIDASSASRPKKQTISS